MTKGTVNVTRTGPAPGVDEPATPPAAQPEAAPFTKELPRPGTPYMFADKTGRPISIMWWTALEKLRFSEIIGSQNASNPLFLSLATPAFLASQIGDLKCPIRPQSRAQLEARLAALGDDGLEAFDRYCNEHFPAPDQIDEVNALKNG